MGKQFKKRNAPIIMSMSPLEHSLRYTRNQDKRETKKKRIWYKIIYISYKEILCRAQRRGNGSLALNKSKRGNCRCGTVYIYMKKKSKDNERGTRNAAQHIVNMHFVSIEKIIKTLLTQIVWIGNLELEILSWKKRRFCVSSLRLRTGLFGR